MDKTHPPKPRLTLRVGITGHRPKKLTEGSDRLRTGMKDLFQTLLGELERIRAANRDVFSDEPPQLRAVSALAEGSDRIFAEAALELGLPLFAPLPFTRAEYEQDFKEDASRQSFRKLLARAATVFELPHERPDELAAYEAVGIFMLRQCDLVVTVWDGNPADGQGGTGQILGAARSAGIPIVHFQPNGDGPFILSTERRASDTPLARLAAAKIAADATKIAPIVESIVAPPATAGEQRKRLASFLGEPEQLRNFWFAFPALQRLLTPWKGFRRCLFPPPYVRAAQEEWRRGFWIHFAGADAGSTIEREVLARGAPRGVLGLLEERFAWADRRAVHLAQVYRSSYVFIFLLGALAVASALLPVLGDTEPFSSMLEFVLILTAMTIVGVGGWRAWHRRWLDYRQLAEQLRALRLLALTGSNVTRFRVQHDDAEGAAGQSWIDWYLRATIREIEMPQGVADGNYATAIRRALVEGEIQSQIKFHETNADRQKSMERWLDRIGLGLFVVTALALLVYVWTYFANHALAEQWANVLTFTCAFLPSLGAALFAIRVQGDFDESARLSSEMRARLQSVEAEVPMEKATNFAFMSRAVEETLASALSADLSDWRLLYRGKPLQLNG